MTVTERDERGLASESAATPSSCGAVEMASPGVAAGPAYLVANNLDLLNFPEGAVLVTAFPHPNWAPVLSRAVALVTDRGGYHRAPGQCLPGIPSAGPVQHRGGHQKNQKRGDDYRGCGRAHHL